MATKELYFTGKIKWAKGLKVLDEKYKQYSASFYPTDKSMAEYKSLGLGTKFRMDDEGENFSVRRPDQKVIKDELVKFGAPEVFQEIDSDKIPVDPMKIGNGSDVTIKLSVYDTGYGKGSRLEAVRVDNMIEFIPQKGEGNNFKPPFDP